MWQMQAFCILLTIFVVQLPINCTPLRDYPKLSPYDYYRRRTYTPPHHSLMAKLLQAKIIPWEMSGFTDSNEAMHILGIFKERLNAMGDRDLLEKFNVKITQKNSSDVSNNSGITKKQQPIDESTKTTDTWITTTTTDSVIATSIKDTEDRTEIPVDESFNDDTTRDTIIQTSDDFGENTNNDEDKVVVWERDDNNHVVLTVVGR